MILFSLLAVFIALSMYYIIGRNLALEKKVFTAQFFYMFFYFLISPFLHYYFNSYAPDLSFTNFESSLVTLNILNSLGIVFALLGYCLAKYTKPNFKVKSVNVNWKLLLKISIIYILLSSVYYIYLAKTSAIFYMESQSEFEDPSLLKYMILESTPIVFAWALISYIKIRNKKGFLIYFIAFVIIAVLFAGLRGSRVTVIFNVVNFVIFYIYLVKRINYKAILLILAFSFIFNNIYSNYKYGGIEGVKTYLSTGERPSYIESKDNKLLHFLLSDLARGDVQAKVIENLESQRYSPPYIPETYVSGVLLIVPDKLNTLDFKSKRMLGTDALYGFKGNEYYSSSRIYGLLGESMLNFGFLLIPLSFILYGFIHYLSNSLMSSVKTSRLAIFLPILFFMPIYLLFYDFDNIVFQMIKNWLLPFILYIVYLGSNRLE